MKRKRAFIIIFSIIPVLALFYPNGSTAQTLKTANALQKIVSNGNLTNAVWNEDGTGIFYQSDENGNSDIFFYNSKTKKSSQITFSKTDEKNPAWWFEHHAVAFESKKEGVSYLFYYDMKKDTVLPLFKRNISCRQPSFDPNGRLVAFSGYDRETERWQLFTYDFVYDNLNRLTGGKQTVVFPVFSPKGNKIIYQPLTTGTDTVAPLTMVNWYGKPLYGFKQKALLKVDFTPDDWRIYFVDVSNSGCQLKSMRKDGTSIINITDIYPAICCPAISPDNTKLAVSIKTKDKFAIYIFDITGF